MSIPNTRLMENPKDKQNSYISIMYQHEINEMKDIFERKKNFKDYASDNLMKNKKYLECLISKRVGKVKCNLIN